MSLKEVQKVRKPKEKFPEEYHIIHKIYSPLSVLHYNLTFNFEDNYPAKMPEDFARDMILLYSNKGDVVWDGCCGSGTVPRIANKLGRIGLGSDVNPKAISLAIEHDKENIACYETFDARLVTKDKFSNFGLPSLILSSLPFGLNIIGDKNNYSEDGNDLSNCPDYESFFKGSKEIIQSYYNNLKPNGVCVLDARDRLHRGKTICLILEFLKQAQQVGFEVVTRFYYDLIPYRQMTYKHKPSGHIKAMPAAMDVIVLVKPTEQNLQNFESEENDN